MAATGRPRTPLVLSEDETVQLQPMARSRSLPAGVGHARTHRAGMRRWRHHSRQIDEQA